MAKVVDITDKLNFDDNPKLMIRGKEIEVATDAPTMLKVMNLMGSKDPGIKEIMDAINLLLPEKSRKEIEKMKLSVGDLMIVVQEAIALVVGDVNGGEH